MKSLRAVISDMVVHPTAQFVWPRAYRAMQVATMPLILAEGRRED